MKEKPLALFFDANDYKLLSIVNDVLKRDSKPQTLSSLMAPYMHPHGIKEMAAPSGLRIAYAIVSLLGSLDMGKADDRIAALRSLHHEVLSTSSSYYQKNTARVLMQIMKELIRSHGNRLRQLKLAHDFRMVFTGKPRLVRDELAKYHLLEMPEEWNQFAFDDHVHDANTKGRKSPTHLVMDAWIKGIRKLTVVYYNYVEVEVVEELLEACSILDMQIRVGIELSCRFRHKFVRFIWELDGFFDYHNLLGFLREPSVKAMMAAGREVSLYQQRYVFAVLREFNSRHRHVVEAELGLPGEDIVEQDFLLFVGTGQPSLLHLAKFIQNIYYRQLSEEAERIRRQGSEADEAREKELAQCEARMESFSLEAIANRYLHPSRNPDLHDPSVPHDAGMPSLMGMSPAELISGLMSLHSSSRFTLNLSNLSIQDTLELLYVCKGKITHIEAFNLKDSGYGMAPKRTAKQSGHAGEAVDIASPEQNYSLINTLQKALNEDNVIVLKRAIRAIIYDFEQARLQIERASSGQEDVGAAIRGELEAMNEQKEALLDILQDIESFHSFYTKRYLGTRIGSGSTGQSQQQYGMGLVVLDTLPARARAAAYQAAVGNDGQRKRIPVTARMIEHQHLRTGERASMNWFQRLFGGVPRSWRSGPLKWRDWSLDRFEIHPGVEGNIVTLGGVRQALRIDLDPERGNDGESIGQPLRYMNTHLKNTLKVLIGFIPAFLTFSLTKDWWVLAYLGAFIWFGITGVRNIIQSILGGGGIKRSPLLPWNSLVSWSRISDSLLYTGFSVPLLDYLVKTVLLQQCWGITTSTNPVLLYAAMGLANGIYISSHNILRGLPRNAAVGNFFRSILSIPLAILLNGAIASVMHTFTLPLVEVELQKWAAIISKFASDCVAGIIEGLADRQANIRVRLNDYRDKVSQVFAAFARLDILVPEEDVLDLLLSPKKIMNTIQHEARDLQKLFIVNALDLMYFWMYQPRAWKALEQTAIAMSQEEWLIFYRSQLVLKRHKQISQVFVDGLVGKHFARALSFYLERGDSYLQEMAKMGKRRERIRRSQGMENTA